MSLPDPASLPENGSLGDGLYRTYLPSITEWLHGEVRERIVIPAGQTTDFSSIPQKGLLGWFAKKRGFDKTKPYFIRSGEIHDPLYWALKFRNGFLPDGWYQFFNPCTEQWEPIFGYQWNRQQADAIWRRVSIEDGCPEPIANRGYRFLRVFGGLHMLTH
jgi:hypothetical protein